MNRKKVRSQARARQQKFRTLKKFAKELIVSRIRSAEHSDNETDSSEGSLSADQESCSEQEMLNDVDPTNSNESSEDIEVNEPEGNSTVSDNETSLSAEDDSSDNENLLDPNENADNEVEEFDETWKLQKWATESKLPHIHLDKLLHILRQRLLPNSPSSSSTFLQTSSAKYTLTKMKDASGNLDGEFVYFGIEKGLKACINTAAHEQSNIIPLQINIDGIPLFKSGVKNFWPILCKIHNDPNIYEPFVVAIYSGYSKPKNIVEYFKEFIAEVNQPHQQGIGISGRYFEVRLQCFICDTPARSFIKCVKGHGGFYACERCETHGERIDRTTVYPFDAAQQRTDESFRSYSQPEHHNGASPLLQIQPPIDMVSSFILDFMHLSCLGAMKKLLEYWHVGDLNLKMGLRERDDLSRRMASLRTQVPCEFPRKPRSTQFLNKFKATEYRFILLYGGPIVLKYILDKNLYDHFLLLHVAFRILCSKELLQKYKAQSKEYLKSFCSLKDLYGPKAQVINMHNLIHIIDDVDFMDCTLSEITAFPFENYLGKIKKLVRSGNRPLAQFRRRYHEMNMSHNRQAIILRTIEILRQDAARNILSLKFKDLTLTNKAPDNIIMMFDKTIIKITRMFLDNDSVIINGFKLNIKKPIYEYPCNSKYLKIWQLHEEPSDDFLTYRTGDIMYELMKLCLSLKPEGTDKVYVIPVLHHS